MGVTVPAHGLRGWVNSQPRGSLGELCVRDLSKNPGNDVTSWQQNPTEPGTWVSRPPQRQGAPSQITCCQDVLLFAPAQRPGPRESSQAECVGTCSTLAQAPPERPLSLCPKEKEGNTGAPGQARSPLPSHPGNPESFACVVDEGFSGCVCLKQAQADVGQKPVGQLCPHPRGEQARQDGKSSGRAGCSG